MAGYQIVFFDLETTGRDTDTCHFIQLSAISGNRVLNRYILPLRPIEEEASKVNGFYMNDGLLCRNGYLTITPLTKALKLFITYLRSFNRPVLLAAHNAARFDVPVLTRVLRRFGLMRKFENVVSEFLDTLVLSRNLHPHMRRHRQVSLVKYFLHRSYDAHNAEEDVRMLQKLFYKWNPDGQSVRNASF